MQKCIFTRAVIPENESLSHFLTLRLIFVAFKNCSTTMFNIGKIILYRLTLLLSSLGDTIRPFILIGLNKWAI